MNYLVRPSYRRTKYHLIQFNLIDDYFTHKTLPITMDSFAQLYKKPLIELGIPIPPMVPVPCVEALQFKSQFKQRQIRLDEHFANIQTVSDDHKADIPQVMKTPQPSSARSANHLPQPPPKKPRTSPGNTQSTIQNYFMRDTKPKSPPPTTEQHPVLIVIEEEDHDEHMSTETESSTIRESAWKEILSGPVPPPPCTGTYSVFESPYMGCRAWRAEC